MKHINLMTLSKHLCAKDGAVDVIPMCINSYRRVQIDSLVVWVAFFCRWLWCGTGVFNTAFMVPAGSTNIRSLLLAQCSLTGCLMVCGVHNCKVTCMWDVGTSFLHTCKNLLSHTWNSC